MILCLQGCGTCIERVVTVACAVVVAIVVVVIVVANAVVDFI